MEPTPISPTMSRPESLRAVYLKRLERLQQLRRQHELDLNKEGLRLLDRSLFAAYCACRDAGAEAEARRILNQGRFDSPPAAPRPAA
jgi:hypothetical protein